MSGIVKFPSASADQPDKRFCGQCGRLCQPLINNNIGFGPCVDDADSPIECDSLRRAVVSSHLIGLQMRRPVHADVTALTARLGIPDRIVKQWIDKELRAIAIRAELSNARYDEGSLLSQLLRWVQQGDADERIIALISELRTQLDPTGGGAQDMTMGQIADWFALVAKRASDILSDPGDWETGE